MSMENGMHSAPQDMAGQISTVIEDITQHLTQKPLIYCYSFDLNNQNHIINGIPILSGEQVQPHQVDGGFINPASIADSNSFVTSQGKSTIMEDASNPIVNSDFQEHLAGGGRPIPSASLHARIGLQENLENSAALSPSVCSLEALGPYIFNNWQDTSNPLSSTFGDNNAYEVLGNGKWNVNKFLKAPEVDGAVFLPCSSSIGNMDPNGWQSSNVANLANLAYSSSNCSNELSLSLASPTTGQCSEISCSDLTHHSMNGTRSGLEQASCSSMELSMSLGSHKDVRFSPAILGSRYLAGIQEILVQIATYSFENLEINYSAAGVRAGGNKSTSAFTPKRRIETTNHNASSMSEAHAESPLQRHAAESKKSQLLMLLQLVDNQYSQCLDEIHTVVSAFHAATELDPHIHAHFALQTVSLLYKDLRERISNHILAMGSNLNGSWSEEEKEWSVDTSFIQKHWALQQLKRKDQLWRPQRGLPERSVSVLRDWMFQNFLHPYPKDAEKHLLAVKSGLSRSQVSNWFINARVRLWKPLIEEMYAEMNRRKACRNEEGKESSHRSGMSMNNQMFNIN